jgi:hypothetical protein
MLNNSPKRDWSKDWTYVFYRQAGTTAKHAFEMAKYKKSNARMTPPSWTFPGCASYVKLPYFN